eukprot:365817-Chlamydomonas_euryale.AAC.17
MLSGGSHIRGDLHKDKGERPFLSRGWCRVEGDGTYACTEIPASTCTIVALDCVHLNGMRSMSCTQCSRSRTADLLATTSH